LKRFILRERNVCIARVHIQFVLYFETIFGILTRDYLT